MSIRYDKFSIGDRVTWFDDRYATLVDGREKHGDGPFTISGVIDREFEPPCDEDDQSNWSSMGHSQHVHINGLETIWSGAYFKLVEAA